LRGDVNNPAVEKLLARMERRLGRYAPEGIILWIVGISGILHLLVFARPQALALLYLDPAAVMRGEVWRIFTFLFAPTHPLSGFDLLWIFFGLWFLHTMGAALEAQWGSFRFDLFFFTGAVLTLGVGFLFGPVPGTFVAEALLLAFAVEFPDYQILLLVIPMKVKYLGAFSGALMVYALVTGDLATRAAVAVALGDFLIFCGPELRTLLRGSRRPRARTAAVQSFAPEPRKVRVCAVCGRSDADDPHLEFRVCDCQERCHGKLTEYCLDHAKNH
jgi:hypothetical protein